MQPQTQPSPQEAAQPPGQMQAYQYQSQGGTQWVDGPGVAPSQPVEQDMVFQWVDAPSYERTAHQQQHYLQAPSAPPYPQGMEASHRNFNPASAMAQPHGGLDPRTSAHLLDPHFPVNQGMDYYGGGQYPSVMQPTGQYQQRRDLPYGHGRSQGDQYYDYQGSRRNGAGARPVAGQQRNARGQAPGGNRQIADGAGGGPRRNNEASADAQAAAVLESMGNEGIRSTLTSILESLYEDRIKPMANYVKGRLKERSIPEPIVKSFVELYTQHPDLFIVQRPTPDTQTEDPTIFFVKEPSWFKGWVDIDAPDDPYDESTWVEFAKFLDGEHTFAGGRYGMARELMQRKLPFLAPYSLGEVCHMVQLAIQHRRLIVYYRKMLKPIQTVLCQLSPSSGNGASSEGEEIKDMDDLCMVLFKMLMHHPQGIRLCRMKQMIKHELCRKLSEMAFQCTKLIELFNQECLSSTFVLDTENDGKSIYVRLGDPDKFSDHIKHIYAIATSEGKHTVQAN